MKQIEQLAHDLHTFIFLKFLSSEQECNLGSTIYNWVPWDKKPFHQIKIAPYS